MQLPDVALVYTGGGHGGSLPDVPARDLTAEEVKQHGGEKALIASGLYEKPKADVKKEA